MQKLCLNFFTTSWLVRNVSLGQSGKNTILNVNIYTLCAHSRQSTWVFHAQQLFSITMPQGPNILMPELLAQHPFPSFFWHRNQDYCIPRLSRGMCGLSLGVVLLTDFDVAWLHKTTIIKVHIN